MQAEKQAAEELAAAQQQPAAESKPQKELATPSPTAPMRVCPLACSAHSQPCPCMIVCTPGCTRPHLSWSHGGAGQ